VTDFSPCWTAYYCDRFFTELDSVNVTDFFTEFYNFLLSASMP